jgi:hypothetical protein
MVYIRLVTFMVKVYIYLTLRKIPWFDETLKFITVFTEGFHGHCPGPVQFFTPHFSGNILISSSHVSSGPPPPFFSSLICPMHDTSVHLIPFGLTNNTNNKVPCIKQHTDRHWLTVLCTFIYTNWHWHLLTGMVCIPQAPSTFTCLKSITRKHKTESTVLEDLT